ncbi:MAG: DNA-3-methyladenine glycosylase I [bacterium]
MAKTFEAKTSQRCWWCGTDPVYVAYHDTEWGVPVVDDRALFEKLVLDGFQAGLSWITILKKREAFQRAFKGFEPEKIARFTERDVARLLKDEGIIRSRLKIEGAVKNARAWLEIMEAGDGAFRDFLWDAVGHRTVDTRLARREDIRAESPESVRLAKLLKKRGFTFCGPVIVYAFMQAVGMYNDHLVACPRHRACAMLARK